MGFTYKVLANFCSLFKLYRMSQKKVTNLVRPSDEILYRTNPKSFPRHSLIVEGAVSDFCKQTDLRDNAHFVSNETKDQ